MGGNDSKLEKPKAGNSSDMILPGNELTFESRHVKSTNNLPERDPNRSCGLNNSVQLLERADSALGKDLGILTIEQLETSEKSTFNAGNVQNARAPFIDVEGREINLNINHSNLPLLNEEIQSNLPLLLDNCKLNPPIILNKSQSQLPLLLDNKSRSNSQPFIDNSLTNSTFLIDTNESKSLLSTPFDQSPHSESNDGKRSTLNNHEAVQPSCSGDLHKSAEKFGIVTEASVSGADLKDFTLPSIKTEIEEEAVKSSCSDNLHKSAEKSGITEVSVSGSDLVNFTLPSIKTNINKHDKNEPQCLASIFIEDNNDYELRTHSKKQLKNSPNNSKFKYAQKPTSRKDPIVPESLKEVEKVANRLCSYTDTKNRTGSNVKPSSDQHVLPLKPLKSNLITQQVMLNNLQYMNNFMSDLKSCPIFDEQVLFSLKSLKKSISSLISNGQNELDDQDLELALKILLDSLPNNFQKEKGKVSFENGVPFCKICKQNLSTNFLIVIQHLESENHQKLLRDLEEKHQDIFLPSACKINSKINSVSLQDENNLSKIEPTLKKNHEGVLGVIYNSKINNLDMNLSLYICIPCDYWANDDKIAKLHLTDKSHTVQLNADWSFCTSCRLNIFGTTDDFEEHRSSLMHIKILGQSDEISQNITTENSIKTCNPKVDEVQVPASSASSSTSGGVELRPGTSNNGSDEGSDEESSDETESNFPPKKEFVREDKQENVVVLKNGTCITGK